ncbi:uncharacterized protein LOC143465281 isoform X2 [Clavelina lepadiformis]|uniref:uncharacterized protein LOC143465281 isoform X2 n=1 Tax=Clavelina lepadiformis TaxID=159417 RepID=UPI004042A4F2
MTVMFIATRITLVFFLLSSCVQFGARGGSYFCPCPGAEGQKQTNTIDGVLCYVWSLDYLKGCKRGLNLQLGEEHASLPPTLDYGRFRFFPGLQKQTWNGVYDELLSADTLTLYRINRTVHANFQKWSPMEGCIDVALSKKHCISRKCYDTFSIMRVVFRKGNKRSLLKREDPIPCSGLCLNPNLNNTALSLFELKQTEDELNRETTCYFGFDKNLSEYWGKKNIYESSRERFNRTVYSMPPDLFVFQQERTASFVVDKKACKVHNCQPFGYTSDSSRSIFNYTFPSINASFVCLTWHYLSGQKSILCMPPAMSDTDSSEIFQRYDFEENPDLHLIILVSILLLGTLLFILCAFAAYKSWEQWNKSQLDHRSIYDDLKHVLEEKSRFLPTSEKESFPDAVSVTERESKLGPEKLGSKIKSSAVKDKPDTTFSVSNKLHDFVRSDEIFPSAGRNYKKTCANESSLIEKRKTNFEYVKGITINDNSEILSSDSGLDMCINTSRSSPTEKRLFLEKMSTQKVLVEMNENIFSKDKRSVVGGNCAETNNLTGFYVRKDTLVP